MDSSGFSTCTYQRWFDVKHGRETKKARWVKAHVCTGVVTNVVTDVLVTDDRGADSPQLPELVGNTGERFSISEVSGDKAYMSRENFGVIEAAGGVPYIPFRKGTTGEGSAVWRRMWALYMYKIDDFKRRYHARSNVETTFGMVKAKFGAAVRGKTFATQRNEVLAKFIAHNLVVLVQSHFELGIDADFRGSEDQGGHDVH